VADIGRAEKAYTRIFEKVSQLVTISRESQVTAHWETGKYLEDIKQAFPERAVYGKNFIERLARDLTEKHGKGFSITNLKNMRTFYQEYPKSHPGDFLEWTKIFLLLTIKDRDFREELIQKAREEDLTRIELQSLIDLYHLKNSKKGIDREEEFSIERGSLYLYKRAGHDPHKTGKKITIDCGFNVWRTVTVENSATLKKDILFTTEKQKEKYFIKEVFENTAQEKSRFFTYRAWVERVIDGDTLWLTIDLGFDTIFRQKIRLRGIDTPEINFDEGKKAKDFVQRQLRQCPSVIIKTYKTDKYDRYIADLFYLKNDDNLEKMCDEGILLNSEIVTRGYGRMI